MVEELRRYTQRLTEKGYGPAARKLMDVAESLHKERILPDNLKTPYSVLNTQLAQRVREVVGPLDGDFSIAILLSPKSDVLGRQSASALMSPMGWRELLQSLNEDTQVKLNSVMATAWKSGFRNIGSIRRVSIDELKSRNRIGVATAQFLKEAFEPQPLKLFDRSDLV